MLYNCTGTRGDAVHRPRRCRAAPHLPVQCSKGQVGGIAPRPAGDRTAPPASGYQLSPPPANGGVFLALIPASPLLSSRQQGARWFIPMGMKRAPTNEALGGDPATPPPRRKASQPGLQLPRSPALGSSPPFYPTSLLACCRIAFWGCALQKSTPLYNH